MPSILSTIKDKLCEIGKGSFAFCKDATNYQAISQSVSKIGNNGQEICKGLYCKLKNDTFSPRRRALAKSWMPSAIVYGLTAVTGLIYFTDWSPLTKKLKRKMIVD